MNFTTDQSLPDIAIALWRKHQSHQDASQVARAAMIRWLKSTPGEYERRQDEILDLLVPHIMEDARHRNNRAVSGKPLVGTTPKGQETVSKITPETRRAVAKSTAIYGELLAEYSVLGKMLAICTREELLLDAQFTRQQATGCLARAIFLESIAAKLKPNQTVAEKFKNDRDLRILKERAEQQAQEAGEKHRVNGKPVRKVARAVLK